MKLIIKLFACFSTTVWRIKSFIFVNKTYLNHQDCVDFAVSVFIIRASLYIILYYFCIDPYDQ